MRYSYLPTKQDYAEMRTRVMHSADTMRSDDAPMAQIAAFLDQWVQVNFRMRGYNVGGWAPFKYGGRVVPKRKANAKSADGLRWIDTGAALEMQSGRMRASFLPFYGAGEAGVGSDLPYAQYQSEGTGRLPARRMLPVDAEVSERIGKILSDWANQAAQP